MRKIKVATIGLGRIGRLGHIPEIGARPDKYEYVAVADHAPDRLENLPDAVKNVRKYSSLEELLSDPEVEMVTIGVRHQDHVPMALKIVEAGKIAVIEKPVATSVAEMAKVGAALQSHPGKIFFRHNRRFEPAFMKTMEIMRSGIIGEPQYITNHRACGFVRRNDWMTMTDFYGGLLTNWGPHMIDQALQMLESPVKSIWADVRNVISIGDGDDLFHILLKAENGRVADVQVGGCIAIPGRELEVIGTRGTIVYENGVLRARYVDPTIEYKPLKPHPENPPLKYGNFEETLSFVESKYELPGGDQMTLMGKIWDAIYDDVVNGIPCPVTFEQAAEVVRVTEEALRS